MPRALCTVYVVQAWYQTRGLFTSRLEAATEQQIFTTVAHKASGWCATYLRTTYQESDDDRTEVKVTRNARNSLLDLSRSTPMRTSRRIWDLREFSNATAYDDAQPRLKILKSK